MNLKSYSSFLFILALSLNSYSERSILKTEESKIPRTYRSLSFNQVDLGPVKNNKSSVGKSKIGTQTKTNFIYSKEQGYIPISALSEAQMQNIMGYLILNFPLGYINNCCQDRAHIISYLGYKSGLYFPKVFVVGDLVLNTGAQPIYWTFHVAPMVQSEATGELFVIDPALSYLPINLNQWLSMFSTEDSRKVSYANFTSYIPNDINKKIDYFFDDDLEMAELNLLGCSSVQVVPTDVDAK